MKIFTHHFKTISAVLISGFCIAIVGFGVSGSSTITQPFLPETAEVETGFELTAAPLSAGPGFSTENNDFWLGWPHVRGESAVIYIVSRSTANVSISGAMSWTGTVSPGSPALVSVPASAKVTSDRTVEPKGIHVTSDEPVSVFFKSPAYPNAEDDAYLALPTEALGNEYFAMSYEPLGSDNSNFLVIATEDNTNIQWIDSCGESADPVSVVLNEGDTYQHECSDDVTGSFISSDKPVALIGATSCSYVPYDIGYCDSLLTFVLPVEYWRQEYYTTPLYQTNPSPSGEIIRIMAAHDGTVTTVDDGIVTSSYPLDAGDFVELRIDPATRITASDMILVTEYNVGRQLPWGAGVGDPSMMILFPTDHYSSNFIFYVPPNYTAGNFVNIIAPSGSTADVMLDGLSVSGWAALPGGTHSWVMAPVDPGEHTIDAPPDVLLGAYVHGYNAISDSYNYPAGANLAPLNNPPVSDPGGPYDVECNGIPTEILLDGTGSYDPDLDTLTYFWTTDCPGGVFDDPSSPNPLLSLDGPPPCPVTCTVTLEVDDGNGAADMASTTVTITDTTAPLLSCNFEPFPDDEDEETDEYIEGLYIIMYSGSDNCDSDADLFAFLDVYGDDETCDDEDPDFIGYPVFNGDVVQLHCDEEIECWLYDEDVDEGIDPVINIRGPAIRLQVIGEDNCGNSSQTECVKNCSDPS